MKDLSMKRFLPLTCYIIPPPLLSSMLAVRSGASQVYACEMDTTMATMSRDIIAANGMTDEISVINKISTDLTIPQELPERLDVHFSTFNFIAVRLQGLPGCHGDRGCRVVGGSRS